MPSKEAVKPKFSSRGSAPHPAGGCSPPDPELGTSAGYHPVKRPSYRCRQIRGANVSTRKKVRFTYRMGVNKMASVGCSPLSGTDAANGTVLTKRQQLKQQRDKQRQQEFQQEKRCAALAGCPLFTVFCQWFRNTPESTSREQGVERLRPCSRSYNPLT